MLAKYDKKITDLTTVIEKLESKIKTAPRPMPSVMQMPGQPMPGKWDSQCPAVQCPADQCQEVCQ